MTASYDADSHLDGNRITKKTDQKNDGSIDQTITYAYNGDNELTTETATSTTGALATYATTYSYDLNGSQTQSQKVAGTTLTVNSFYDVRNRLVRYDPNGDTTYGTSYTGTLTDDTTYVYDDDGNRISQTAPGSVTTLFLMDKNNPTGYSQVLEEKATSTSTPSTTYLEGLSIVEQTTSGNVGFLMTDGQGSTRLVTAPSADSNSRIVTAYGDYDAFGTDITPPRPTTASGLTTPNIKYVGQYWVGTLGQYDDRARYYGPSTGRFTSLDIVRVGPGDTINSNLYAYVAGHPTNATDPTGHFELQELVDIEAVQNQLYAINLPEGFSVYNTATNVREAVQIFSQIIRGAPYDSVSAILFGIQFLPIGKVLEKAGAQFLSFSGLNQGVVKGLESELDKLYTSARQLKGGSVKSISQAVGDAGAAMTAKAMGFTESKLAAAYRGIDGLLEDGAGNFIIVEAKGATSSLKNGQLGADWIRSAVEKLISENSGVPSLKADLDRLRKQLDSGSLKAMLVHTPIVNGKVQAPKFWIKTLSEISPTTFFE